MIHAVRGPFYGLLIAAALLIVACNQSPTSPSGGETTFLSFNSAPGDWVGAGLSRRYTVENATFNAVVDSGFGQLTVTVNALDRSEWWTLRVTGAGGAALLPKTYEPVTGWTPALSTLPRLGFSGTGRGCSSITGRFVVRSMKYGRLGEISRFHLTFEQTCSGASAPLIGELRIVDGGTR